MEYIKKNLPPNDSTLEMYLHEESENFPNLSSRPAVLIFPGGGYAICSDREAEPVALAYLAQGFQAFVLRYSVGENSPFAQSFKDAKAALEYIRKNAEAYRILPDKIAVIGFSAGGHLAACLGTISEEKPNALVLAYSVILENLGSTMNKVIPDAASAVSEKTPPTFVFGTSEDKRVPSENSLYFALALAKLNIDYELHIFEKGIHGLSLANHLTCEGRENLINADAAKWFDLSVSFLNRHLFEI